MIAKIISRDSDVCAVLFARGSYQFGLLDAGLAGTATLRISASASGMSYDTVKPGSFVHIFPQYGMDHWHGLVVDQPIYDAGQRVYVVTALQLHGFLGDIASVTSVQPASGSQADDARPD